MKFKILIISLFSISSLAYAGIDEDVGVDAADEVVFEGAAKTTLYKLAKPLPQKFNNNISLDRTFSSLNEFTSRLQSLTTIRSKVVNGSNKSPEQIRIFQQKGTIKDLLNQVALKFDATWTYDENKNYVMFKFNDLLSKKHLNEVEGEVKSSSASAWVLNPRDKTLRTALTRWCREAGWQLVWNVKADYPITNTWKLSGSFEQAINEVLKSTQSIELPLIATMHESNRVLEIHSSEDK